MTANGPESGQRAHEESHVGNDGEGGQQPDQTAEDDGDEDGNDQENYGADATNGGYNNVIFSGFGDANQMQMMMAMQNGMGPNTYGNFPMMGMHLLRLLPNTDSFPTPFPPSVSF